MLQQGLMDQTTDGVGLQQAGQGQLPPMQAVPAPPINPMESLEYGAIFDVPNHIHAFFKNFDKSKSATTNIDALAQKVAGGQSYQNVMEQSEKAVTDGMAVKAAEDALKNTQGDFESFYQNLNQQLNMPPKHQMAEVEKPHWAQSLAAIVAGLSDMPNAGKYALIPYQDAEARRQQKQKEYDTQYGIAKDDYDARLGLGKDMLGLKHRDLEGARKTLQDERNNQQEIARDKRTEARQRELKQLDIDAKEKAAGEALKSKWAQTATATLNDLKDQTAAAEGHAILRRMAYREDLPGDSERLAEIRAMPTRTGALKDQKYAIGELDYKFKDRTFNDRVGKIRNDFAISTENLAQERFTTANQEDLLAFKMAQLQIPFLNYTGGRDDASFRKYKDEYDAKASAIKGQVDARRAQLKPLYEQYYKIQPEYEAAYLQFKSSGAWPEGWDKTRYDAVGRQVDEIIKRVEAAEKVIDGLLLKLPDWNPPASNASPSLSPPNMPNRHGELQGQIGSRVSGGGTVVPSNTALPTYGQKTRTKSSGGGQGKAAPAKPAKDTRSEAQKRLDAMAKKGGL